MRLPEPFVIAEISANHNGSLNRAVELVGAAADAGADAVKFQCYTPDTITLECDRPEFRIDDGPWAGKTLHQLYTEAHTPRDWFPKLFQAARGKSLYPFAPVFSKEDVDFLETLDCPIYKIASFEVTDIPLIRYVRATEKPVIISTGMASPEEWRAAMSRAYVDRFSVTLMHCISAYPAEVEGALTGVTTLVDEQRERYVIARTGLSDHTLSTTLPAVAVGMGATVIEKHLTLSRGDGGPDASFSLEPHEFKAMVDGVREAWSAIRPAEVATPYKGLRRSLRAVKPIEEGEAFTPENVRSIRPGGGLHPAKFEDLMGRSAKRSFSFGEPITEDQIDE